MSTDRLIDEAAHAMTTADVRPDLRVRVLAAIDREDVRRAAPRRAARVRAMATLAAAAVIGVGGFGAVAMWQQSLSQPPDVAVRTPPLFEPPLMSAAVRPPSPDEVPAHGHGIAPQPVTRPALSRPTADELAWQARAVPALAVPAALEVAIGQPAAPDVPLLDVAPLRTEPLQIAPISADDSTAGGA